MDMSDTLALLLEQKQQADLNALGVCHKEAAAYLGKLPPKIRKGSRGDCAPQFFFCYYFHTVCRQGAQQLFDVRS